MDRPVLMQTVPKGLMVAVMIVFVAAHAPYIKGVSITSISRHGGVWTVEGTITIDPAEVPSELQYNYAEPGFLSWWEEHINEVLETHGVRAIHVRELELEWQATGDLDEISFQAEIVFGHAKGGVHK